MLLIEDKEYFDNVIAFAKRVGRYDGEDNHALADRLFIGVVLAPDEQEFAVDELAHALRDASARMVGRRQRVPGARRGRDGERLAQPTSSRRPRSSP